MRKAHTRLAVQDDDDHGVYYVPSSTPPPPGPSLPVAMDHHTIISMSLRAGRFAGLVLVCLAVAFAYAFVSTTKWRVATVSTAPEAEAAAKSYSAIVGAVTLLVSRLFEIYTETLLFPTLHTYLHNCSLYPGDDPQRVTSGVKTSAIFWLLKTVLILMNVGFTSLFVTHGTLESPASPLNKHRELPEAGAIGVVVVAGTEARPSWLDPTPPSVSPLRRLDVVDPQGHCTKVHANDATPLTAVDIDYTAIERGFRVPAWGDRLRPMESTTVGQFDVECCLRTPTTCIGRLEALGVEPPTVVTTILEHGLDFAVAAWIRPPRVRHQDGRRLDDGHYNETFVEALARAEHQIRRWSLMPPGSALRLRLERQTDVVTGTTLTLLHLDVIARRSPTTDVRCGPTRCVLVTHAAPTPTLAIAPFLDDAESPTSAVLVAGLTRRVDAADDAFSPVETLTLSFGRLTWPPSSSSLSSAVDAHQGALCLPLAHRAPATSNGDSDRLCIRHEDLRARRRHPRLLARLHVVHLPNDTTWLPMDRTQSRQFIKSSCDALVDAYVEHLEANDLTFAPHHLAPAAWRYLTQDGVIGADVEDSRRQHHHQRQLAPGAVVERGPRPRRRVQLQLSISIVSAGATFVGCAGLLLLAGLVVWRPAARVRLTCDTTPAAAYVQILTDDMYPDIVHKKRLRFPNGDTLPFNEYVVDAIVLHAKCDATKKIVLSA